MDAPTVMTKTKVDQLVVNWHVTEACNFNCRYCFSSWNCQADRRDVIFSKRATTQLLVSLAEYFNSNNMRNPLTSNLQWDTTRLSIAGGEALLYPEKVKHIARFSSEMGLAVSLITNGSLLTTELTRELARHLSVLGISIDSMHPEVSRQIGRADRAGEVLNLESLRRNIQIARTVNPDIEIKINTVVNSINYQDNIDELIEDIQPEKWKVFRALPVLTEDLSISSSDFDSFGGCNQRYPYSYEDNHDMTESYIMVDPLGRFFQNSAEINQEKPYSYSEEILEVGVEKAFSQIKFNADKFSARYPFETIEITA